jgi:hypothetical protein
MKLLRNVSVKISFKSLQIALVPPAGAVVVNRALSSCILQRIM